MKISCSVQKRRLLIRFMVSYIAVLSIPLVVTLYVYYQSVSIVKNDALEENLRLLEQSQYMIETSVNEVDRLSIGLGLNEGIKNLLYKNGPIEMKEIDSLFETWKSLDSYASAGNFIKRVYIVFPESNTVMSNTSVYNLNDFYGFIYRYKDMSFENWRKQFLSDYHKRDILPSSQTYLMDGPVQVLTYVQSMPIQITTKTPLGTVIILINKEEVIKPLSRINTGEEGNVYIIDGKGNMIASKNSSSIEDIPQDIKFAKARGYSERKVDGKGKLYSYSYSKINDWTFVAVLPSDAVLEKVNYIKGTTLFALFFCLIVGIAAAYILSYRNVKPIRKVIKILSTRSSGTYVDGSDEYGYLQSAVSKIIEDDMALNRMLEENIPIARGAFFQRLIRGELNNNEAIYSNMMQVQLEMSGRWFNVLLVYVEGYSGLLSKEALQELNAIKAYIKNIQGNQSMEWYSIDIDESSIAFVLAYQYETSEECLKELEKIVKEKSNYFKKDYDVQLSFAAGNYYNTLSDMYYSFNEAKQALKYGKARYDGGISWHGDVKHIEWVYYYPVDLEQRIINMVKAGNKEEVAKILEIIKRENFEKNKITYDTVNNLYNEMKGSILKIVQQGSILDNDQTYDINSLLGKLQYSNTGFEAYEIIKGIFMNLCDIIEGKKRSQNVSLRESVIKFVDENYMHYEMCLSYVAQRFNLSEVYLSNFFKEQTGENFSDYVERIRIETACELILNGKNSIEEIAYMVGYSSSHAFRRVFKRTKGVIPSRFKENQNSQVQKLS